MFGFGRKLVGALMVIIGGFFVVVAITAIVHLPQTYQVIKAAPLITDGVLDPANEGKTVILQFHIEDVGDAVDDELGLSFGYPCVAREVEKLTCTLDNKKWEWRRVRDTEDTFGSRAFCGDAGVKDYQIDGDLLRGLALYRDLGSSDFNQDELDRLLGTYDNLSTEYWNDRFYLTNSDSIFFDDYEYDGTDSSRRRSYERQEGALRIRYKGLPRESYSKIAVIGRQEGNWIVEDERVDTLTVFENVKSPSHLARRVVLMILGGIALAMAVCVPLIFFGVRRFLRDY